MINKLNKSFCLLKLKIQFKQINHCNKLINLLNVKHNKIYFSKKLPTSILEKKYIKSLWHYNKECHQLSTINHFNLYKKFICFIFYSGKKAFWENAISTVFFMLSKKLGVSRNFILLKLFLRLHTRVELRQIRFKRRISIIPVFIKITRRFFLSIKWLLSAVKKKKIKNSLKKKLFIEIYTTLTNKTCWAVTQIEANNLNAYKNRSNAHFRW